MRRRPRQPAVPDRPRPVARYARFAVDEVHLPPEARPPPFDNSELVERALQEVKPDPDYADLFRQEFIGMIRYRQDAFDFRMRLYPSKEDKRELNRIAKALDKAQKAIASLSRRSRTKLFVVQFSHSEADKQAARFREWTEWIAGRARLFARDPATNDPRSPGFPLASWHKTFRRGEPWKKLAAEFAYQIFEQFGDPPASTVGGPFFNLAQIFFEAMTGLADENLDWQCREVLRAMGRRTRR